MIFKLRKSRILIAVCAILTAGIVVACGPQGGGGPNQAGEPININGAGASFPAPFTKTGSKPTPSRLIPTSKSVINPLAVEQASSNTLTVQWILLVPMPQ